MTRGGRRVSAQDSPLATGYRAQERSQGRLGASCYNHRKSSSPSPREERAGRGTGRGASSRMGLLSPTLSCCWGGEGANLLRLLRGCNKMRPRTGTIETSAITGGRILEPPPKARGNGARLCAEHHSSTTTTSSSCSPRRKRPIVLRTAGRQKSLRGDRRNFVPLPRLVHPI